MSIIDYTLHQLLTTRGKKGHIQYDKIMDLNLDELSTPTQIRDNINGMIRRLQQRLKCKPLPASITANQISSFPLA